MRLLQHVAFLDYFVRSQTSIFLHAVFYAKCNISLFHIIILQLLLFCTVKPANIRYAEQWKPPNRGYFLFGPTFLSRPDYTLLFIFGSFSPKC